MNKFRRELMFETYSIQRKFSQSRVPQLHSTDGYFRVELADLQMLNWQANYWLTDAGKGAGVCGEVEWSAHQRGAVLSLGWDWCRQGMQRPRVNVDAGLRTNIWVQDARGYDLSYQDSQANLLRVIEQINWAALVYAGH